MSKFLDILASGAKSLSFEKRRTVLEFNHEPFMLPFSKPRTPAEIMRSAWEDVGNRMWEAIGEVKKEYEQQPAK